MYRKSSVLFSTILTIAIGAVALVGQPPAPTAVKMSDAANKFLGAIGPDLRSKAKFAFDDKQRLRWFFTPQQDKNKQPLRKGARLAEMNAEQKQAAFALLETGLSKLGFEQASTIMSLEGVLAELEGTKGANTRDSSWYFVSVFGEPSKSSAWSWRFEGHHMSVNYTLDKGEIVAATPIMFGANPAEVKSTDRKGLRTLPAVEDQARALIKSLSAEQDKVAKQPTPKNYDELEIKENHVNADVGPPVGIALAKLELSQKETLFKLLEAYASRMPEELAASEMKKARSTLAEQLFFAYTGSPEPGKPYTYRIYAPTFVVEFLNVQADSGRNPANHIHSAWRRLPADFGESK